MLDILHSSHQIGSTVFTQIADQLFILPSDFKLTKGWHQQEFREWVRGPVLCTLSVSPQYYYKLAVSLYQRPKLLSGDI